MNKLAIVTMLSVVLTAPIAASAERIRATLTGYEEVPVVSTDASGEFVGMINRGDQSIDYQLTYTGPQGAVTQAHISIRSRAECESRRHRGTGFGGTCGTRVRRGTRILHAGSASPGNEITAGNVVAGTTIAQQLRPVSSPRSSPLCELVLST